MQVEFFIPRFIKDSDLPELVNLWHLSRTHSSSRYERMLWTSKHFGAKVNLSATAVYKDLEAWLNWNN